VLVAVLLAAFGCSPGSSELQAFNHTEMVARLTVLTNTSLAPGEPPRKQTFIVPPKTIFDLGGFENSLLPYRYEARFDEMPETVLKWDVPGDAGARMEGVHIYEHRVGAGGPLPWKLEMSAGPVFGWILFILLMALPFAIPSAIIFVAVRRMARIAKEEAGGPAQDSKK
jgi:hypothetical protein